ncbi:hypothetical protein TNCV_1969971 [Trichonephila clavipes]|nr:hypothetical protein TNCV_1969971 [Trichonephila clavipes]
MILWKDSVCVCVCGPVQTYKLNTVNYGTTCAPYLATRTIQQLAKNEGEQDPLAAAVIIRDIYMDDIFSGYHAPKGRAPHSLRNAGVESTFSQRDDLRVEQINLEVDNGDTHSRVVGFPMVIDELIEIYQQEQDIEELQIHFNQKIE